MPLAAGSRYAQYQIVAPLGAGGMGEVYRARDLRLDRDVAIKVMSAQVAADPEMRQRFETEVKAVAALSHPSILAIYELAIVEGLSLAVMELLEGGTLRERISRGPLEWRDAVRFAAAIAEGLAAAHARGVIHRDLKPENVFLTSAGAIKILDFGLALHRLPSPDSATAAVPAITAQGVVLGTFGYMSPEQVTGGRVDGRSDIFALGCVLYEMLSGRRLVAGTTPQEIVANLLHDAPVDLSTLDPLAPPELRAIVGRAVDRERDRRFESAGDLAMALHALLTGSAARAGGRRPRPRGKSIAVLPFVNAGADAEIEYITDGITESVINSLSQLEGLRVVPRSLVFRYKGLQADPATVGLALNARTILTGRVMQHGDGLNIQAELVDTTNESQLWGERFRQKTSGLQAVQEEIAWQISEALRLKFTAEQQKKLRQRTTVNPEAYQEYLRGRYHWHSWSPEGFRRALEHYERAIALDPKYAQAYAGLGDTFGAMAYYGYISPADGFPRARAAAARALELDRDLAEAHVTLAIDHLFSGWDWAASEAEFKKAIALAPKQALAHTMYSLLCSTCGRHEESMVEARLARDLEPLSVMINMGVAWSLLFARRFDQAIHEALQARQLVPGLQEAGNILVGCYEMTGQFERAVEVIRSQPVWGFPFDAEALLAAFRAGGPAAYWRARLQMLEAMERAGPNVNVARAFTYVNLDDYDNAIRCLGEVVAARLGNSVFIGVDPVLTRMRGHAGYDALVRRVGIPLRQTASAPHTAST